MKFYFTAEIAENAGKNTGKAMKVFHFSALSAISAVK
jgi:hypothetical protein